MTQATITLARASLWSIGTKNWYVVKATDHKRYQRWSHLMDSTDEVLLLAQPGDILDIEFEDAQRGEDTVRVITKAVVASKPVAVAPTE